MQNFTFALKAKFDLFDPNHLSPYAENPEYAQVARILDSLNESLIRGFLIFTESDSPIESAP
jgi:hypothetical protein